MQRIAFRHTQAAARSAPVRGPDTGVAENVLVAGFCRLVALLAILVTASGCGQFTFLYGFAESAIARETEFHLDLNEEERAFVEAKTAELVRWHSSVMLPRYAEFLDAQAEIAERGGPSRQEVAAAVERLRILLADLVAGVAPFTAEVLVDHTAPERLRYLEARMSERLEERREEASAPLPERLEERVDRIVSNFERLIGDLNDAQLRNVRRYAAATAGDNARWLSARANRQRAFTEFLAQRPDEEEIATFVKRILLRPHDVVDPDYKAISDARWSRFEDFLFEMASTFTPDQRTALSETLRGYASEMRAIADRAAL